MLPHEFEQLQPHEFMQLWDGYCWRKEETENMQAYFAAATMSVHTKNPVAPKVLIEPLRRKDKKHNRKDDEKYLREKFKLDGGEK